MMSILTGPAASTDPAGPQSRRRSAASSSVAIGTATFIVIVAAVVGLALDGSPPASPEIGSGWHLRGALGAAAAPPGRI